MDELRSLAAVLDGFDPRLAQQLIDWHKRQQQRLLAELERARELLVSSGADASSLAAFDTLLTSRRSSSV